MTYVSVDNRQEKNVKKSICSNTKKTLEYGKSRLQGLSEPEFYGDLVYKFRKIIGNMDFPYHFKK